MKKLLMTLCCLPAFALASETGENCSKIEDGAKRLECYDGVFAKKDASKEEATAEKSKWEYEQEKDKLRNATTYLARIRSTNTIDFGFPYDGSAMNIMLRKVLNMVMI